MPSAFEFLQSFGPLHRSARKALHYAPDDPNHCLIEIRKFGERLTDLLADTATPPVRSGTTHDRQLELRNRGLIPRDVFDALVRCRRTGNDAVHGDEDDAKLVRRLLEDAHAVGAWFVQREGHPAPPPFVPDAVGKAMDAAEQERQLRERLVIDLRVPMSGFAARGRIEVKDVDALFVPPRFGDELKELQEWPELVHAAKNGRRVAIAGPGGSGKSTLCRALARALLDDPTGPIPLLLPLATLEESLRSGIVRRVREHLHVRLDGDVLENWLSSGRAVLILDGMDEARDPEELAGAIEAIAEAYHGVGVLVTGRPAALSRARLDSFSRTAVQSWHPWQAEWFLARLLDEPSAQKILTSVRHSQGLWDLLRSPLMVTLVALVWRERGDLPEGRGAILDAAIRTMLETWPVRRRRNDRDLPFAEQLVRLQRLAAATLDPHVDPSFAGFAHALGAGLEGERWLEHVIDETGILHAAGPDRYEFFHLAVRDRLAMVELLRSGVDVVSFVVGRATTWATDELSADLVQVVKDRPGLALELLQGLRDRDLPNRGAWHGASRAWWLGIFREFVRRGLVLDQPATETLLEFVAQDRLRVYRAMNANEPMWFGDETLTMRSMSDDIGAKFLGRTSLTEALEEIVPEATVGAWLRAGLKCERGERLRALVALALERLEEGEILSLVGDSHEGTFWLWPRSPAGRIAGLKELRSRDTTWPGEDLARRAASGLTLESALADMSDASDWLGRALSVVCADGGRGLVEATAVLILRQSFSVGFRGEWSPPALQSSLHSGPWPCIHLLAPRLGGRGLSGLGGAHERFRGPMWLGWRDQELAQLVRSTGMRTPRGLFALEGARPWPDVGELDALPVYEVPQAIEAHQRLASAMGLVGPSMYVLDANGRSLGPHHDTVPLTLRLDDERTQRSPTRPDRFDLRQTWVAEVIAASIVTRGMPDEERLCHLQQRLQCRAASNLWGHLEKRVLAASDTHARELLLPAMLWAQRTLTGTWSVTPWVEEFLSAPAEGWLPRAFQSLFFLEYPGIAPRVRREFRRSLKDDMVRAGDHPAAALLRSALHHG
jgi:hypothetical protein